MEPAAIRGAPGVIKGLSDRYQVIAIDNRGYGQSDKPHDPTHMTAPGSPVFLTTLRSFLAEHPAAAAASDSRARQWPSAVTPS